MKLTLTVLRCPDHAVPEAREVPGGDFTIGRGTESDWVLQDPDRVLSKRHCTLEYRSGSWQLRDTSTNGTFLNRQDDPIGRDQAVLVNSGDRIRLGQYEIEVRVDGAQAWAPQGVAAADPYNDPFGAPGGDSFAGAAPLPGAPPPGLDSMPGGGSPGSAFGGGDILPDNFDPFADEPVMPDHAPAASDAFLPPPVPMQSAHIPDDWDPLADLGAPAPKAAPAMRPSPAPPPPAPMQPRPAAPTAFAPPPTADLSDPFAEEAPLPSPAIPPEPAAANPAAAPSLAAMAPAAGIATAGIGGAGIAAGAAAMVPAMMPVQASAGSAQAAIAAFLAGAGLSANALGTTSAEEALHAAGAALRAAVSGLRALLIARADVKREFRIEQTMLRSTGNNPVKFAATDDAAIAALLAGRGGPQAVEEAVTDLTTHQVASLAATQAAARALLEKLAPGAVEAMEQGGGGLFGGSREKKLWEAYKKLHAEVGLQFEDDFDSAFGKHFARAYEQAARRDGG